MPELTASHKPVERPLIFQGWGVVAIQRGLKMQTRRLVKSQPMHNGYIGDQFAAFTTAVPAWEWHHKGLKAGYCHTDREALIRLMLPLCPYGVQGDRLWVKETFALQADCEGDTPPFNDGRPIKRIVDAEGSERWWQAHYRATDPPPDLCCENPRCKCCRDGEPGPHWKSSMFMPRWASRLLLEITEVRVQRVQEITVIDCQAEGIRTGETLQFVHQGHQPDGEAWAAAYADLWNSINAKRGFGWDANPWVWALTFRKLESA